MMVMMVMFDFLPVAHVVILSACVICVSFFFWTFDLVAEETAAQQTNASHMVDASWAWRTRMCTSSLSSSCIVSSRSSKISATASKHALLDLDLGSLAEVSVEIASTSTNNFQTKMDQV